MRPWWLGAGLGVWLLSVQAQAQDPSVDGVDAERGGEDTDGGELVAASTAEGEGAEAEREPYTVVVIAEERVERARQALYEAAREAGFRRIKEKKDRVILRHDATWKGDIVVKDDGTVFVKRQPVRFEPPVKNPRPIDYLWCVLVPICIRPGGQTYGRRKWLQAEANALAVVREQVEVLDQRIGQLGLARKIEDLAPRLEALWEKGEPLDGGRTIQDMAGRRAALGEFWATRTDTPEGQVVRDVVHAYIRNVVQYSDDPFTPEEIAGIEASATVREPFLPGWTDDAGGTAEGSPAAEIEAP